MKAEEKCIHRQTEFQRNTSRSGRKKRLLKLQYTSSVILPCSLLMTVLLPHFSSIIQEIHILMPLSDITELANHEDEQSWSCSDSSTPQCVPRGFYGSDSPEIRSVIPLFLCIYSHLTELGLGFLPPQQPIQHILMSNTFHCC